MKCSHFANVLKALGNQPGKQRNDNWQCRPMTEAPYGCLVGERRTQEVGVRYASRADGQAIGVNGSGRRAHFFVGLVNGHVYEVHRWKRVTPLKNAGLTWDME